MKLAIAALLLFVTTDHAEAQDETPDEKPSYAVSFGGQYRIIADGANFDFHPRVVLSEQPAQSFVNQRFRTWLNFHDTTKANHGVHFQVEIGHIVWGDDLDFPKTYQANGEEVGVEFRRGYLWYKPSDTSLLRVGILDWHDRFGGRPSFEDSIWAVDAYDSEQAVLANSVWDFNVGGIAYDFEPGEQWHASLATAVLTQGDTIGGDGSALLFSTDVDREVGSSLYGASVYYLHDRGGYSYGDFGGPANDDGIEQSWDLWMGVRGHHVLGKVKPSYFFIWNRGATDTVEWKHSGWAVKGDLDYELNPGTRFRLRTFYASGNDNSSPDSSGEFRTIAQTVRDNFGAQGYWSLLGLSTPRGPSDVNDLGVSLQNRGLGLFTLQGSFEQRLNSAISTYAALGWLSSAENNPVSDSSDMGVELLGEARWTLAPTMAVDFGAAYLWTGDFYRAEPGDASPANLYEVYARFQLEFAVVSKD